MGGCSVAACLAVVEKEADRLELRSLWKVFRRSLKLFMVAYGCSGHLSGDARAHAEFKRTELWGLSGQLRAWKRYGHPGDLLFFCERGAA